MDNIESYQAWFEIDALAASERFKGRADALRAALEEGQLYTAEEAEKTLAEFFERRVC